MHETLDLLWNVDRPNHQVTVRLRTGTTIQMVRFTSRPWPPPTR
jgi:hypothetical protein